MSILIVAAAIVVAFGVGFGLGRVKNAAKLKAVSVEIASIEAHLKSAASTVEAKIASEISSVLASIKKHL